MAGVPGRASVRPSILVATAGSPPLHTVVGEEPRGLMAQAKTVPTRHRNVAVRVVAVRMVARHRLDRLVPVHQAAMAAMARAARAAGLEG